jgi:Secretion system C-terminal sorting domain
MKTRLVQSCFFFLMMLGVFVSSTFGQTAASVTWNLIGADSLSPTTTVGNVTGKTVTNGDTIAIIDTKSIPNSPISGKTNAVRWAPYVNGAKVSWGNETMQNGNRWIQFAVAPNTGNMFIADSISIYLGASGTTDHIRANLYYSSDPTFANKTLLNASNAGVLPYRDSLQHFGYHIGSLINEGDTLYFRVYPWYDTSPSTSKYLFTQYAQIFGKTIPPTISVDSARKAIDSTVTVVGVTISPNFQTSNRSYYIWDGTGGLVTFKSGLGSPDLKLGDLVMVTGKIGPFNGLLEIQPASDTNIVVLGSGAPLPKPEVVSISEFNTNGEMYESHLIEIKNLALLGGSTWPTSGSKSIFLTDGTDTVNVFLDSDMKLFNYPQPKWPVDLIGIGSQYAPSGVGGYQVLPRFITDFKSKVISIDSARKAGASDTVLITGVTISPNFQTSNRSYYIWDGTGGIVTFKSGLNSPALKLGDSVAIAGKITTFNGLLEIQPLSDSAVVVLDSNAVMPDPEVVTISQYLTNGEDYESHLVEIKGLTLLSGTWPTSGSASLFFTDGTDTVNIYLDSDMGIYNSPEPTWPADIIGIGSQYAPSGIGGYQILPRSINDFMSSPVVPVELTSFSAKAAEGAVVLSWKTATEVNNSGFEVQRSADGKSFTKIGFVNGHGSTVKANTYTFSDKAQSTGMYYRLKQIDYSGAFKYSDVIQTSSAIPKSFSLLQNYPNPFNPTTVISYDLPKASRVTLKVFDILGNEVSTLINQEEAAGSYKVTFSAATANHKQLSSGIYFYRLQAGDFTSIKKMMLIK